VTPTTGSIEIVDAQVHVWPASSPDGPWPQWSTDYSHGRTAMLIEEVRREMADAGVSAAVLNPPTFVGNDNRYALDCARLDPQRFAVVGRLVADDPREAAALPSWMSQVGMRGIRAVFMGRYSDCLRDGDADWLVAGAAEHEIPLMVYAPGQEQLLASIASRYEGLRVIIDHMNLSIVRDGDGEHIAGEIDRLLPLARHPNVGVKLSGIHQQTRAGFPFAPMHEPLERVFDAFGPHRCFWASDLSTLGAVPYRQIVDLFLHELPFLGSEDLGRVMGASIRDWLDWPR
jgi:predicted TIM-barrel fold metal-dependent hydrolase